MPGLEKLLRGILRYRADIQPYMVQQFKEVADRPDPKALVYSCIDSRVLLTKVLGSSVGDMLLVRNAGNLVPNCKHMDHQTITTDAGALELACVINKVENVIVCGHSDCKAMNLLYSIRDKLEQFNDSPLQTWLRRYGSETAGNFQLLDKQGQDKPLVFSPGPIKPFSAFIDPDNKFSMQDKFSQVNTLQQVTNIASYSFMHDKLKSRKVRLHAMWFDVYTGDFYLFSRAQQRFVIIKEANYDQLMSEALGSKADHG